MGRLVLGPDQPLELLRPGETYVPYEVVPPGAGTSGAARAMWADGSAPAGANGEVPALFSTGTNAGVPATASSGQPPAGALSLAASATPALAALPPPVYVDFSTEANIAPGYYRADPSQLRFTQPDASPFFSEPRGASINDLIPQLQSGAITADQVGKPLQIVIQDGIPFSIDNRRVVAFNAAGLNDVPIQVVSLDDPVVADRFFSRFDPIGGTGEYIVITPSKGRDAAQQLLYDYGLIKGYQIGK